MNAADQHQAIYEDLAEYYEQKGEARPRDLFLVLAADAAHQASRRDHAERLRSRLLQLSPHNMLRPFSSFADALKSPDIQDYVADLRRQYPPDQALTLMQTVRPNYQPKAMNSPAIYRFQQGSESAAKKRPVTTAPRPAASSPSPYDTFAPYQPQSRADEAGSPAAWLVFVLGFVLAVAIGVLALGRPFLPF